MEENEVAYSEHDTNEVAYSEEPVDYTQAEEESSQSVEESSQPVEEDPQEKNWREVRKKMSELEKQNEELRAAVSRREYEEQQYKQYQQSQEQQTQSKDDDIDEDDLLTYGQWKKIQQKEKQVQEQQQKAQRDAQAPALLRQKYDDFDIYVTQENIEKLSKEDPELAETINALEHDKYKMGKLAYEVMKSRYGQRNYEMAQDKKVKENKEKPMPANSVKRSNALSSASAFQNGLTPELKAQLWKEMEESIKHR